MYYDNRKLILSIFEIIVGIVLMVMSCMEILDSTIWAGVGGGLIAVGIVMLIRCIRYKADDSFRKQVDIEANDERNRQLRMKAWSIAGYVTVIGLAIVSIAFGAMGRTELAHIFSYIVCFILVIYLIAYVILKRTE